TAPEIASMTIGTSQLIQSPFGSVFVSIADELSTHAVVSTQLIGLGYANEEMQRLGGEVRFFVQKELELPESGFVDPERVSHVPVLFIAKGLVQPCEGGSVDLLRLIAAAGQIEDNLHA